MDRGNTVNRHREKVRWRNDVPASQGIAKSPKTPQELGGSVDTPSHPSGGINPPNTSASDA